MPAWARSTARLRTIRSPFSWGGRTPMPVFTARDSARQALELLCSRRPSKDGWGYNQHVPPDADTTICVCRLARAVNRAADVAPALSFLERCLRPDGGLATYASQEGVRRSMHWKRGASFPGLLR